MKIFLFIIFGMIVGAGGVLFLQYKEENLPEVTTYEETPKPLLKYSIENLSRKEYKSLIVLDEQVNEEAGFTVHKFHFDSDGKKVTGLVHLPIRNSLSPVIIQFRGYAQAESYYPGYGTSRSAEKYAKAGFITIAPDFLGYGDSASPSSNVWEARFETYTTALNLLAAVGTLPMADPERVGIWGHSNGGQIALTVLEVTGKSYPTVLWAPMSMPFPYSILYYLDENGDGDRELRNSLAEFELDYDYKDYNPLGYLERINAPIEMHHGTADEAIPIKWADKLVSDLKKLDNNVSFYRYLGADHNFLPIHNWNQVIERDIEFFKKYL